MSKADAPAEAEGEAPKKGGGKKKLIIIIVAVVLLLVIAGGVVAVLLMKKSHSEDGADGHAQDEPAQLVVDLSHPPTFVTLEPFTVNLAPSEGDHFLQVVMVLKVVDHTVAEQMKAYTPEIRHEVNMVLSSKLPSEITHVEGREALAVECMERINNVLGFEKPAADHRKRNPEPWGPVTAVLFNSFIVQ